MQIKIDGDFIKLDTLIKLSGIASTGGQAKIFVLNGDVKVNGEVCLMRGKKLRSGDKVSLFGEIIEVI
ncbi:MAG: RNA-binding S4 domain-containing protein [Clostridia bacterium]|nr:RNA-binding S4 domain-containing protein [Clostridia bacterium]